MRRCQCRLNGENSGYAAAPSKSSTRERLALERFVLTAEVVPNGEQCDHRSVMLGILSVGIH